jgi:hypothetical protein
VDSKATVIVSPLFFPLVYIIFLASQPFFSTLAHLSSFLSSSLLRPAHPFPRLILLHSFSPLFQGGILLMVGGGVGLICASVAYQQKKSGRW